MDVSILLFYGLATIIVFFALAVVISDNPIYSALYLAITMVTLAFVYFLLKAFFIAGVQLIVYAGAVMVLFVMVMMMFDLKKEKNSFSKGKFANFIKVGSAGWLCGLIFASIMLSKGMLPLANTNTPQAVADTSTKELAILLYTDYIFAFELLGLLLLLIAVGAVAVSRIKGGTHE